MINKKKKCKGIGKANKYSGCNRLTLYRKYGLCTDGGKSCYASFLLDSLVGGNLTSKAITKAKKPRKDYNDMVRTTKENKSLEALKKTVVNLCHKYIRLRDTVYKFNTSRWDIERILNFDSSRARLVTFPHEDVFGFYLVCGLIYC